MGGSAVIIHARPGSGVPNSCCMVSQRIGLPVPQEAVSIFQLVQELHPCQGVGLAPDLGLDLLHLADHFVYLPVDLPVKRCFNLLGLGEAW